MSWKEKDLWWNLEYGRSNTSAQLRRLSQTVKMFLSVSFQKRSVALVDVWPSATEQADKIRATETRNEEILAAHMSDDTLTAQRG